MFKGMEKIYMRAAIKVMPSFLLCWHMTIDADVGDMTAEIEPSHQYSITFCCHDTDGSRGIISQNSVWHGSLYEAKVCN